MTSRRSLCLVAVAALALQIAAVGAAKAQPGYEQAYVNDQTVTITAIEFNPKQTHLPPVAQADFYETVYPWLAPTWQDQGIPAPQCSPCDHDGNGIDPPDFHDHVLDSMPGITGYRAPWHVYVVLPAYNGDPVHDSQVSLLYGAQLPMKSEAAVDATLAMKLGDGSPLALKIDTHFYFLCAVVSTNAPR